MRSLRTIGFLISSALVLIAASSSVGAPVDLASEARAGVAWFTDTVLDRCKITFEVEGDYKPADGRRFLQDGTILLARSGTTIFLEEFLHRKQLRADGKVARDVTEGHEYFLTEGQPGVDAEFARTGLEKKVTEVVCDPALDYEHYYNFVLTQGQQPLLCFLGPNAPFGKKLLDLIREPNWQYVESDRGSWTGSYASDIGTVHLVFVPLQGKHVPSRLTIEQTRENRFNSGIGEQLGRLKRYSPLNPLENGVDSITCVYSIDYPTDQAAREPFTRISYAETSRAGSRVATRSVQMRVKEYANGISPADIIKLRTPIPDGTPVSTPNPALQSLDLMWLNNQVVRRVDGVALDAEMVAALSGHRWYWRLALGAVALGAMATLLVLRYSRSRGRPGLPHRAV